jgi:hypothetical protein
MPLRPTRLARWHRVPQSVRSANLVKPAVGLSGSLRATDRCRSSRMTGRTCYIPDDTAWPRRASARRSH